MKREEEKTVSLADTTRHKQPTDSKSCPLFLPQLSLSSFCSKDQFLYRKKRLRKVFLTSVFPLYLVGSVSGEILQMCNV